MDEIARLLDYLFDTVLDGRDEKGTFLIIQFPRIFGMSPIELELLARIQLVDVVIATAGMESRQQNTGAKTTRAGENRH